jgi:hypothetical protein
VWRQRAPQDAAKATVLNPATAHGVNLLLQIGQQRVERLAVQNQGVRHGIEFLEQSTRSRAAFVSEYTLRTGSVTRDSHRLRIDP